MNELKLAEMTQFLAQLRFTLETEVSAKLGTDTTESDIIIVASLVSAFILLLIISIVARKQAVAKAEVQQERERQEQKRQEVIKQAVQAREQNLKQAEPLPRVESGTKPTVTPLQPQTSVITPVIPAVTVKFAAHVPQDSMLRRHYISHVRAMLEALTLPRPTDSALRRHYEQLIASQLEHCLTDNVAIETVLARYQAHQMSLSARTKVEAQTAMQTTYAVLIPQDSMLRRHYLTHLRSMLEALTAPRPTDSALRRHYEQLISSQLEEVLTDQVKMANLLARYAAYKANLASQNAVLVHPATVLAAKAEASPVVVVTTEERPFVPEDATLKRHYINHLRSMFEALIFSRPTDCVLRRHYEQFVNSEIEDCLNNRSHLERLICCYEEFKHNLIVQNTHSHSH
jgi:hypothetical protein